MKINKSEYNLWVQLRKNSGTVSVRSYISGDGNFLSVYLVKKNAKGHRWVLKLIELSTKTSQFKKLSKAAANIQKAKGIHEKNYTRGFSLLFACSVLSEELACINKPRAKTVLNSDKWTNSPDKESDQKTLSGKKPTFSSQDIKSTLKMERAAFVYPFKGVRIDIPPAVNRVPEKLLTSLLKFTRSKSKRRPIKRAPMASPERLEPLETKQDLDCYFELNGPQYIVLIAGERRFTLTEGQASLVYFLNQKALLGMPMVPVSALSDVPFLTKPNQWKDRFRGKNGPDILKLGIKTEPGFLGLKIPIHQK